MMHTEPRNQGIAADTLLVGKPRFKDPALAALAAREGDAAAWRTAFAVNGILAPAQVTGEFAVAIGDGEGRSYLAVDRFATRGLCYRIDGRELRFAERADVLAKSSAEISPQAIFEYLFFHVIPSPRTVYAPVQRLPPGHCARFENGQLTVQRYWTPHFKETRDRPFTTLRDEFRGLIEQAVQVAIGSHAPGEVGCFLSGGTDSSTIAGMFGRVTGLPPRTYSIGFHADGYDEMEYARIAARHFGCRHHEYYLTPADLVRSIPDVAVQHDQPFGNSSALPAYYCAKLAVEDGIECMLAGDGGDELFGGNTRYATQRIFGLYGSLPALLRERLIEPLVTRPMATRLPLLRRAGGYVRQAKLPMPDRLQSFNLLTRLGVVNILTSAFLSRVDIDAPMREQRMVWSTANTTTEIDRMLAFDWRYTLAENDLPKVRGAAALAGVEVGFPFLSDELLDFSARLPGDYKLRLLALRWFFKKALRGFLPDEIISKKKHGFGLPFGVWATHDPALRALAQDSLSSLSTRGLIRSEFLRTLVSARLPEAPGYYGELVWILVILEHWLQAYAPNWRTQS